MRNEIEKIEYYSSSPDGRNYIIHPTLDDVVNKINEIIDLLNKEVSNE